MGRSFYSSRYTPDHTSSDLVFRIFAPLSCFFTAAGTNTLVSFSHCLPSICQQEKKRGIEQTLQQ
ncbi:hypothetical protein U1Q18_044501, partial [Sarracenia purpurea var. burkii]